MKNKIQLILIIICIVVVNFTLVSQSSQDNGMHLSDLFNQAMAFDSESGVVPSNFPCHAGGGGATSCSVNLSGGGGGGSVGFGCTVTCGSGYYACCNRYYNRCVCRKT